MGPGGPSGGESGPGSSPAVTAGGGQQASGRGAGSAAGSAGPGSSASVRGVTDSTIKIGVAWPDYGFAQAIKANWTQGDMPGQMAAVLDRWKREGAVPVHGRNVQFVYRKVSVLDASDQRAACVELVQDQKVFAVVGPGMNATGLCAAQEFKTPAITDSAEVMSADQLRSASPYLFSLPMTMTRLLRNWVQWADKGGYLKGKRIGLYYFRYPGPDPDQPAKILKDELGKLGYKLAAEVSTDNGNGGPDDNLAVQRFRAADVNLALLVVAIFNQINFMQYADSQGYRPTYIDSDYIWNTNDNVAEVKPANQYNGTHAMSSQHTGEFGSNAVAPEVTKCIGNYERFSGRKVQKASNEWIYTTVTCDVAEVLLRALQAAGRNLTPASFITGVETIHNLPTARHGSITFTASRHEGEDGQRTVRWDAACREADTNGCWRIVGDTAFKPLWVN